MKIFQFLFLLGVCFTIFEFIWGIFKIIFNLLTRSFNSPVKTNSVRILKYILFTAVTIQFVEVINVNATYISKSAVQIGLGALVILFYLIGKYQNRSAYSQIKGMANQFMRGFMPVFDNKLELTLIFGSVGFFILGSFFPLITENAVTGWFTDSILNIYTTPFFGFIFKIIAFFVIINALTKGAGIIGKLLSGKSFAEATKRENPFGGRFTQGGFGGNPFQNRSQSQSSIPQEPEFTEYEEVKDDEV